jgi:hypothetical protein
MPVGAQDKEKELSMNEEGQQKHTPVDSARLR